MTSGKTTMFAFGASLLALAALSGGAFAADKSKGPLKVAIFSVNGASPTIHTMIESATEAAKARGWTVETYDGNGDQVATNNQANTFITRGFDALINIASDNNQMGAVIANAAKAKIPFVSTFSGMVPGITVDTHVLRLSRRLGLTKHTNPEKVERDLMVLIPQAEWTMFSHRLIFHGRQVCFARKPNCEGCLMNSFCPKIGVKQK